MKEEIEFLLEHAARYLVKDPLPEDVQSVFAGIRPLVSNPSAENTAAISRDHVVNISKSGLVTITGGKWTTYRKMAEDAIENAAAVGGMEPSPCVTENLQIHGYHRHSENFGNLRFYGSDAVDIENLAKSGKGLAEKVHPDADPIAAEVIWAVRNEMAVNVDDFLARRRRSLFLNARLSMEMAPRVAELMQKELKKSRSWKKEQLEKYISLAGNYIL
jgi:glycerol-3-phosphate dehydrogenase